MVFELLLGQYASSKAIVRDAWRLLDRARTVTATVIRNTEEVHHEMRLSYWFRKGSYFRAYGTIAYVKRPKNGWRFRTDPKVNMVEPPLPAGFKIASDLDLGILRSGATAQLKWSGITGGRSG